MNGNKVEVFYSLGDSTSYNKNKFSLMSNYGNTGYSNIFKNIDGEVYKDTFYYGSEDNLLTSREVFGISKEGYTFTGWKLPSTSIFSPSSKTVTSKPNSASGTTASFELTFEIPGSGISGIISTPSIKRSASSAIPISAFINKEIDFTGETGSYDLVVSYNGSSGVEELTLGSFKLVKGRNYRITATIAPSATPVTVASNRVITIKSVRISINGGNADKFYLADGLKADAVELAYNIENIDITQVALEPIWEANKYNIKYNGNGATGGLTADSTHTYGSSKALTANGYTKGNHKFIGWSTTPDGDVVYTDGQSVKNLTAEANETIILYAQWERTEFPRGFYVFINGEWKYCKAYVYNNYTWHGDGSKIELEDKYLLTSDRLNLMTSSNLYLKGKKG